MLKDWCLSIRLAAKALFMSFVVSSCVTTPAPILEFTLADTAIKAAKSVSAVRHSPGFWHEAEESYRQAKILYNEREYEQAKELFIKARIAAEKSENSTRLIQQRNGEIQ